MARVDEQFEFAKDVALLLTYIAESGYKVTLGEVWRTVEQQQIYIKTGRSKTMNSRHLDRCAIDLNIFKDSKLLNAFVDLEQFGKYWETLNVKNKWGGYWHSFKDLPHFERKA